jgi:hypothetical protein
MTDGRAEARSVAERRLDLRAEMRMVHDDRGDAAGDEALDLPDEERLAAHGEQRLGHRVGQGAHALAAPGGEDKGSCHR